MTKLRVLALSLLVLAMFAIPSAAFASGCPTITVDENGNGTLDFSASGCGGGIFTSTGKLMADPGPGGLSSVLTYNLLGPPSLVAGDILLEEGPGGPVFDVIRFNPANPATGYAASIVFYSDNVGGFDSLADTFAPPSALYKNTLSLVETGPEGNNGASYTPTAGQPGFVAGFNVTYNFISDSTPTPEPASLLLFGTGLLGLAGMVRKLSV